MVDQGLVEQFVAHPAVETLNERVLRRLAGRDVVPVDLVATGPAQIAFDVNSVPASDRYRRAQPSLPRPVVPAGNRLALQLAPELRSQPGTVHAARPARVRRWA